MSTRKSGIAESRPRAGMYHPMTSAVSMSDAHQEGNHFELERLQAAADGEEEERIWSQEYLPLLGEKGYLAHRVFLGSEGEEQRRALLEIKDSRSRPRIRLMVDENDRPSVQVLDEAGNVTSLL